MGCNRSSAPVSVKDDEPKNHAMIFRMQLLKKTNDPITLQILCDLLESGGINYHVEGAGMNSLLPLPGLIEARVMVDEEDLEAATAVLTDIEGGSKNV